MDVTKGLIAAAVVGGLYLASRGKEDKGEESLPFALEPKPAPQRTVEQITISPDGMGPQGFSSQATGQFRQGFPKTSAGLQEQGMFVLGQTAYGKGELRYEQKVTAKRLIERLKQGDQLVFKKPLMARDVNIRKVLKVERGNNIYDPAHPSALSDAQQQRMTIELTDWAEYRFVGTLLAAGYIASQSKDEAQQTYGLRLLDWFHYHRWYIGDGLKEKMCHAAYEASCRYKYSRGPGHKHRNYPIYWTQKTDQWGQTIDCGITRGRDEWRKEYPAIDNWRRARDGRYPLRDTQDFNKQIPAIHTFCHDQDRKTSQEVKARFASNLGLDFWGIDHNERPNAGPCGAMVEYAAARYMQVVMCGMIDPKLGQAAGGALLGALQAGGGLVLAAIGTAIAGASAVPVAGWIAAGVMAIISAITGFVGLGQAIDKIRSIREAIYKDFDGQLKASWKRFGLDREVFRSGVLGFSGHRLKLLIPVKSSSPVDWREHWEEITDPLFSHYALSRTIFPTESVPQLPPHYLGIDFPLPVGIKQPDNTLMVLLPVCKSAGRCKEPNGQGSHHMQGGCPDCKDGNGAVWEDCPTNATVAGYRDCAFEYPVYGAYLQKAAIEYAKTLQATQSAYLTPSPQTSPAGSTNTAPALQQPQLVEAPKDNKPLLLAAAVVGAAFVLSQRR